MNRDPVSTRSLGLAESCIGEFESLCERQSVTVIDACDAEADGNAAAGGLACQVKRLDTCADALGDVDSAALTSAGKRDQELLSPDPVDSTPSRACRPATGDPRSATGPHSTPVHRSAANAPRQQHPQQPGATCFRAYP